MKLVLVPILILLLLTQTFSKWMWVLEYNINKEYISKNLCENKARPQLKCHGKCQLTKKLAEDEKKGPSQNTNTVKVQVSEVLYDQPVSDLQLSFLFKRNPALYTAYRMPVYNAPSSAFFHPPAIG